MKSYFELRRQLAREYPDQSDWRAAAADIGLDPSEIALQGAPITVWSNIFDAVRNSGRVQDLRSFLTREEPQLLPQFEDCAAVFASGETVPPDLPELQIISLGEEALDPDSVRCSLDGAQLLTEE